MTLPCRKTAIAVPEDLLHEVDRAAQARGESRSKYIVRVLRACVRARHDAEITKRLNDLFADEAVQAEQRSTSQALDEAGSEWPDERW